MSRPPSRRTDAYFTPNPYYEGDGVLVLIDRVTGRRQHMAIYSFEGTRTDFLRRARHHLRVMNDPYPPFTPPPFRFRSSRQPDDDPFWE